MHIVQTDWELAPDSVEAAGWGLRLQAESEAKLGLLMLQGGEWNGKRLVSSQWIHDMTQRYLSTEDGEALQLSFWEKIKRFFRHLWHTVRSWFTGYNVDDYYLGYGYQTKTILQPRAESFFAAGYGGQLIDVIPKLDMVIVINGRAANYGHELNTIYYHFLDPLISGKQTAEAVPPVNLAIGLPQGDATHPNEMRLLGNTVLLEDNLLGMKSIELARNGEDRIFTMNDRLGTLRAVASCGEWRITTDNERPIYIMETREQLIGVPGPFKMASAYAWQNDTLSLRLDWLDGGDNRRLKMAFDGNNVTVMVNDNFDALLTDTIQGKLEVRN